MTTINEPLATATGMPSTRPAAATAKIAIAGAGHVGVTLAYACLIRGTGKTIALYGRNAEKVRADRDIRSADRPGAVLHPRVRLAVRHRPDHPCLLVRADWLLHRAGSGGTA